MIERTERPEGNSEILWRQNCKKQMPLLRLGKKICWDYLNCAAPRKDPWLPQGAGNQIPEDEALAEWCWYHRGLEDVSTELGVRFV